MVVDNALMTSSADWEVCCDRSKYIFCAIRKNLNEDQVQSWQDRKLTKIVDPLKLANQF